MTKTAERLLADNRELAYDIITETKKLQDQSNSYLLLMPTLLRCVRAEGFHKGCQFVVRVFRIMISRDFMVLYVPDVNLLICIATQERSCLQTQKETSG
jgi:hypothetical protein